MGCYESGAEFAQNEVPRGMSSWIEIDWNSSWDRDMIM